jgi:hypothetical protein
MRTGATPFPPSSIGINRSPFSRESLLDEEDEPACPPALPLVGLMLAQASENEHLEAIFKDLLDEEGPEICLRAMDAYVPLGEAISFYEMAEACRARGEVAIGHHA